MRWGRFGRSGYTTTVTKTQVHMYLRFCGRPARARGTRGSFYHMAPTAQPLGSAVDETMRETGDFGDVPDGARSHARPHFHRAAASGPTSSGRAHSPSQNPIPTALSAGRPQSHMTESPLRARIGPSACALSRPSTPRAPLASPLSPRWALSFIEGDDHTHPSHSLTLPVPPSRGPSRSRAPQDSIRQLSRACLTRFRRSLASDARAVDPGGLPGVGDAEAGAGEAPAEHRRDATLRSRGTRKRAPLVH